MPVPYRHLWSYTRGVTTSIPTRYAGLPFPAGVMSFFSPLQLARDAFLRSRRFFSSEISLRLPKDKPLAWRLLYFLQWRLQRITAVIMREQPVLRKLTFYVRPIAIDINCLRALAFN